MSEDYYIWDKNDLTCDKLMVMLCYFNDYSNTIVNGGNENQMRPSPQI